MAFHRWLAKEKAWSKLKPRVRALRRDQTPAESLLWNAIKGRRLAGLKFRRQHAIGEFIVDFYCPEAGIAIEVDGPVHGVGDNPLRDRSRDAALRAHGIRVLRVTNEEVASDIQSVLTKILLLARSNTKETT